jgi:MFS transporter, ACS family, aldohexuronate transporter
VSLNTQSRNETHGFKLPGLRWWIVGLIFLATLINYIDRQTVSVLGKVIKDDLGLSNYQFGKIGFIFLLAYTISQTLSGKLYDRVGTRLGFVFSITVWSLAAMAHAFARGIVSLSTFRFILGLGEAGNWPGAAKTVAEWFPIKERAFGMAIFNSGAAIGAIIAPPTIVWLQQSYGWQRTFLVTGCLGFMWLILWLIFYQTPDRHPWLRDEERALILAGQRTEEDEGVQPSEVAVTLEGQPEEAEMLPGATHFEAGSGEKIVAEIRWRDLLRYRQVWAIAVARFLVDPIWWLYLFWLPLYLIEARGFNLSQVALFAWVPYVAADAGSLIGGWASGFLISRGWTVGRARKTIIAVAALLMPAGILAARAQTPIEALAWICVVLFGFQVWINNVQTLPSDFFPDRAVASVAGIGGTGAGLGAMLFTLTTGWVVDHFSYTPILVAAGLFAPIGTVVLFGLAGHIGRVQLKHSPRRVGA